MTKPDTPEPILVPIDLHGINRSTLETLVRIARQLQRGVVGLLLEDIQLQQVADLPFTTEITLGSGRERSLLRDHLSQRHSLVSSDTRRLLDELAHSNRVEVSFENASGERWRAAFDRDQQVDIFFPARQRWHSSVAGYGGRTGVIKRLGLLLPPGPPPEKLLNMAGALLDSGLVGDIYVLSRRAPLPEQLHDLYRQGHQVRLQANFPCDPASIIGLIRQSPYDLLLLPGPCLQDISPDTLDAALDKSSSQVLIVN